ncbi:MAG: YciI family protein [Actinomycetota bacterium]
MRYLLLIYGPQWDPSGLTPEQIQASMDEWTDYTADLVKRGVMESGEALEPTHTATTVRLRNGETLTTDGPFAETNEVLGGFYLLNCKDLDEVIELAAACPGARNGSIELRPITDLGEDYQKAVQERAGIASS